TTGVSMFQSWQDSLASEKMEEDLARMLAQLEKIASESDVEIPGLDNLLAKEMEAQSRSNPDVMSKLSDRVAADGGDPRAVLGKHLSASEMNTLGNKVKGGGKGGSNSADKAKIKKLEKKIADMEAKSKSGGDETAKLQAQVNRLKERTQKMSERQEILKQRVENLKEQNENLKKKMKKQNKNTGSGLWSTKG
ncbi:MAG: hypothetical protein JXX29_05060, partial [Deltaproteobacteria bacterium]|nr:hypothetical protein [Deltaproteobacteria bacterium]MBN2671016.1 hypothetical protein [Deltaproteobacteria bacterium]